MTEFVAAVPVAIGTVVVPTPVCASGGTGRNRRWVGSAWDTGCAAAHEESSVAHHSIVVCAAVGSARYIQGAHGRNLRIYVTGTEDRRRRRADIDERARTDHLRHRVSPPQPGEQEIEIQV